MVKLAGASWLDWKTKRWRHISASEVRETSFRTGRLTLQAKFGSLLYVL